jgi:hypothetical protein
LLAVAVLVGLLLPVPAGAGSISQAAAFVTFGLLLAAWGGFRSVRPIRFNYRWKIAEYVAVPLIWMLLVGIFGYWLQTNAAELESIERELRALEQPGVVL